MPLQKGHSQMVVSHNIKEMIRSGYKPKQAIAASLANARKYKKMATGGMVDQSEDQGGMEDMPKSMKGMNGPGEDSAMVLMGVPAGGLAKDEPMEEMDDKGPEDQKRSLNEIREDGEYYPDEVANPQEMKEAQGFAQALRKQAMSVLSPENYYGGGMVEKLASRGKSSGMEMESMQDKRYAMGGLVQDGPEEDERLHGNQPEYIKNDGTEAPMSTEPMKPDGLEHKKMGDPMGMGLSEEAKKAIMNKKKSRRFGMYDPKA